MHAQCPWCRIFLGMTRFEDPKNKICPTCEHPVRFNLPAIISAIYVYLLAGLLLSQLINYGREIAIASSLLLLFFWGVFKKGPDTSGSSEQAIERWYKLPQVWIAIFISVVALVWVLLGQFGLRN